MVKKGRKNKYDSHIKPRFYEISKWVEEGATLRSIAKNLGVSYSVFNKYKAEKKELKELLKKSRSKSVDEIENSMFKSALGGIITLKKPIKVKKVFFENGKKIKEEEEVVQAEEEIYIQPNTTAGIYLLKHWGRDRGYTNDPLTLELKKQELEHKKKLEDMYDL